LNIVSISDTYLLKNKFDLVKLHFYNKLIHIGIIPYDSDINVISELYMFGGYNSKERRDEFFELCYTKKYKRKGLKNGQSIRNTLALYTDLGVLTKEKYNMRNINEEWLPLFDNTVTLMLDLKISHLNARESK